LGIRKIEKLEQFFGGSLVSALIDEKSCQVRNVTEPNVVNSLAPRSFKTDKNLRFFAATVFTSLAN